MKLNDRRELKKKLRDDLGLQCVCGWFRPILGVRGSIQRLPGFGEKESKRMLYPSRLVNC